MADLRQQALALRQANQPAAAESRYLSALAHAPTDPETLLALADLAAQAGRPDEAREYARRLARAHPDEPLCLAASQPYLPPDEALPLLDKASERHPESAALHFQLGNAHARSGNWRAASQAYLAAAALAPEQPAPLFNAAVAFEHLGRKDLAIDHYRRARRAADFLPASFHLPQAAIRLRQLED